MGKPSVIAQKRSRSIRLFLIDPTREVRAAAFRSLRYMLVSPQILRIILDLHIDLLILRAVTRDTRNDVEREQALKLIRTMVDRTREWRSFPRSFIRLLVSAAEQPDEKLRDICVETLCELAFRDTPIFAQSGGMKALFWSLADSPSDLCESILMAIVVVLDREETRQYIKAGVDVDTIVSPITNSLGSLPSDEQLQQAARSLLYLVKTWTGLIYLCLDDKRVVKAVLEAARLPSVEVRTVVLDMLFEIFLPRRSDGAEDSMEPNARPSLYFPPVFCFNNYMAVVLVVFIESKIFDALIEIIQDVNKDVSYKATILVGELLDLCGRLLPKSYGDSVFSLPSLFDVASDFREEGRRHTATAALAHIDDRRRVKETNFGCFSTSTTNNAFTGSRPRKKSTGQVEHVKIRVGMQIDEDRFRLLISNTGILAIKDYTKWNWDAIMELVQGPLYNAKRLEDTLRNTKLVKRLLAFFRPANRQFSSIPKSKARLQPAKYVRIGSEVLSVLVSNPEGARYLLEDPLLGQIAQCLMQLDPFGNKLYNASMPPQAEPIFSRERIEKTMSAYYFTLLGNLSRSPEGIGVLERFKIFDLFYHMTELKSRDDIAKAIITNLDYRIDGHSRILLSKVLTCGYKPMRYFATRHLRYVARSQTNEFKEWGIRLLITQLYDPSIHVREMAVKVLDEACSNRENLDMMIQLRPTLDHLGTTGVALLLRCLSTSTGFSYLSELKFIESQMDQWFEKGNLHYVTQLELSLASAVMGYSSTTEDSSTELVEDTTGTVLPHFYGELTKTAFGCELLRKKEHFVRFVEYIRRRPADVDLSIEEVSKLKSVLWAVGHVGSNLSGFSFLDEADVLKDIVALCETSPVLSIRGRALEYFDWQVVSNASYQCTGLCVPRDFSKFLTLRSCQYLGSVADNSSTSGIALDNYEPLVQEVLKSVGDMPNHILATAASKTIARQVIRHDHPDIFTRVDVYLDVMDLLSTYSYRMTARRYLAELFGNFEFNEHCFAAMDAMRIMT
ncbi:ARM repeat-containing protein [Gonapodya prolifera JEL478]|uniref:ARM repeat-containing protein n=1 Tax=Gonapodya prolifera (strain JEL478) TaxID=1344416 RepID=A0A139AZE9_GONPJ|nr:ARM repeat-containing protein [Gonapodya prolifera JEL478]|eukprot:KXS22111.1 ARM repeat-containing protein [Gonapodya prolifera JEL478]